MTRSISPPACSGGMKAGVPIRLPAWVCEPDLRCGADLRPRLRLLRRQCIRCGRASLAEHFGEPPVHHLDLAEGADHDVGGLQIAMNNAVGVGVADGLAHGLEDGQQPAALGRWVGPLLQDGFECAPLDELHGQERPAIGEGADLMHGRDARVLQLASDPRLTEERWAGTESAA